MAAFLPSAPLLLKLRRFVGKTPAEAEAAARAQIPAELIVAVRFKALGHTTTYKGRGNTAEEAVESAKREALLAYERELARHKPLDAAPTDPGDALGSAAVTKKGTCGSQRVAAFDEFEAEKTARRQCPREASIKQFEWLPRPRKVLFGLFTWPGKCLVHWATDFEAEVPVSFPAVAEVTFRPSDLR
jgi:hypothetical protein